MEILVDTTLSLIDWLLVAQRPASIISCILMMKNKFNNI